MISKQLAHEAVCAQADFLRRVLSQFDEQLPESKTNNKRVLRAVLIDALDNFDRVWTRIEGGLK